MCLDPKAGIPINEEILEAVPLRNKMRMLSVTASSQHCSISATQFRLQREQEFCVLDWDRQNNILS